MGVGVVNLEEEATYYLIVICQIDGKRVLNANDKNSVEQYITVIVDFFYPKCASARIMERRGKRCLIYYICS